MLEKAGLRVQDIAVFEINEAFASVVLAWQKELKVPSVQTAFARRRCHLTPVS